MTFLDELAHDEHPSPTGPGRQLDYHCARSRDNEVEEDSS